MRTYESGTPRFALGFAAVALTALTFGIGAVLPVATGPSERVLEIALAPLAPQTLPVAMPSDVRYIEPIEVIAVRSPNLISARELPAKRRQPS